MNACFTWKFMTRYATYFFIATPPPCFFALLRIPLTPNETQKWPTDFNGSRERAWSRIRFFFPPFFELCSSRSIKINFERLHVACSVSWYSLWSMTMRAIKIPSIPFFFSLSLSLSERNNGRGAVAFLLEAISYRVSRAELSCCSTRSSLPFCPRVFLTYGKVW